MINLINRPIANGCRLTPTKAHIEHLRVIRPPILHVRSEFSVSSVPEKFKAFNQKLPYDDPVEASMSMM